MKESFRLIPLFRHAWQLFLVWSNHDVSSRCTYSSCLQLVEQSVAPPLLNRANKRPIMWHVLKIPPAMFKLRRKKRCMAVLTHFERILYDIFSLLCRLMNWWHILLFETVYIAFEGTDSVLIKFMQEFDICSVFELFSMKIKLEYAQNRL